jgi:hypothetical protein
MMDCTTARLFLAFARPNCAELEGCTAEALDDHLAECTECGSFARAEHHFERRLGPAMRDVPLPPDLRQRLLTRLQGERKAWYRNLPNRHPRVAAAVAALLLLGIGMAVYLAIRPPRPLDLQAFAENWNGQVPSSPEQIQKVFEERGFKIVVPSGFNYQYLDSYDLQPLGGTMVPHLFFIRGSNHASVYIVPGSQFDIRAAVDQPREGSGRFTVELRPGPANSNIAYLIKYTGGSLDWLVEEEKRSTT